MNFTLFTRNGIKPWLEGFLPSFVRGGNTVASASTVWRESMTENLRISNAYADNPLELSNVLLLKTKENMLLSARLNGTAF